MTKKEKERERERKRVKVRNWKKNLLGIQKNSVECFNVQNGYSTGI